MDYEPKTLARLNDAGKFGAQCDRLTTGWDADVNDLNRVLRQVSDYRLRAVGDELERLCLIGRLEARCNRWLIGGNVRRNRRRLGNLIQSLPGSDVAEEGNDGYRARRD